MADPDELVVVYTSTTLLEAQLVRNMLAAEGISVRLGEINEPLAGLPIAPIEVLVRLADEDRARSLIDAVENARVDQVERQAEHDRADDDETSASEMDEGEQEFEDETESA